MKVYCYTGCGTCKKALKYLKAHHIDFELLPIRETPPSPDELTFVLKHQSGNLKKLFNTASKDYREGEFSSRLSTMTPAEAIEILSANGNLIKRPFVVGADFGLVGFSEEVWNHHFLA